MIPNPHTNGYNLTPKQFQEFLDMQELTRLESRDVRKTIQLLFRGQDMGFVMEVLLMAIKEAIENSDEGTDYARAIPDFLNHPIGHAVMQEFDGSFMKLQGFTKNAGMTLDLVLTYLSTKVSKPLGHEREKKHG